MNNQVPNLSGQKVPLPKPISLGGKSKDDDDIVKEIEKTI